MIKPNTIYVSDGEKIVTKPSKEYIEGLYNLCIKNETVCHVCGGTTVGDYGQPFECQTCMGSGSLPVFEIKY